MTLFTQSDMHVSDFGVDTYSRTALMDFGQIGQLPLSFAKFIMRPCRGDFIARVANLLCWPDTSNMA